MILKNLYDGPLAHASYLVGCPASGEAIVIDPNRDIDQYVAMADAEGLRIVAVTETHIHADYVSGSKELAERTGATLYLSDEGTAEWKYAFANDPNVRLVRDGDAIRVSGLRFDVVHTPGHTPEHVSFILTDEAATTEPCCAFTGDFVFVGDVGRPDLLERAAGFVGTMEAGAKVLFASLQKFRSYPETMLLWPAHGAGSACGKSLGGVPTTSLGYELKTNWAFGIQDEATFVESVLAGQPEPPAYFKEMKRVNKVGPAALGGFQAPTRLAGTAALAATDRGAMVLDIRPSHEAASGTLPGAVNISLAKGLSGWAGSVLPFDVPIYLVAAQEADAIAAKRMLQKIGYDHVGGWFGLDVLKAYVAQGGKLQRMEEIRPVDLKGDDVVVDLRGANERSAGTIPGALHIPLGSLSSRMADLPRSARIVVHCAGGGRSPIGATILQRAGFPDVANLEGGYGAYAKAKKSGEVVSPGEPVA